MTKSAIDHSSSYAVLQVKMVENEASHLRHFLPHDPGNHADATLLVTNALKAKPGGTNFFNGGASYLATTNGYASENDLIRRSVKWQLSKLPW